MWRAVSGHSHLVSCVILHLAVVGLLGAGAAPLPAQPSQALQQADNEEHLLDDIASSSVGRFFQGTEKGGLHDDLTEIARKETVRETEDGEGRKEMEHNTAMLGQSLQQTQAAQPVLGMSVLGGNELGDDASLNALLAKTAADLSQSKVLTSADFDKQEAAAAHHEELGESADVSRFHYITVREAEAKIRADKALHEIKQDKKSQSPQKIAPQKKDSGAANTVEKANQRAALNYGHPWDAKALPKLRTPQHSKQWSETPRKP